MGMSLQEKESKLFVNWKSLHWLAGIGRSDFVSTCILLLELGILDSWNSKGSLKTQEPASC